MKFNKINIAVIALAAVALMGCKNEDLDKHHYNNKLFISAADFTDELLIKASITGATRDITVGIAKPVDNEIEVKFAAAPELLETYRLAYYDPEAIILPAEHYAIENPATTIQIGSVRSAPVTVEFINTGVLDRDLRYVLPVTIASVKGIDMLPTANTVYYVFKGAALINVVANISQNYAPINWKSSVGSLKTITVEALIRVSDFGTVGGKKGEAMSTLFGIEGGFLVRIGDSGFPQNQIQMVNRNGNFPDNNSALGLPTNKWVHVAAVWDATTGDRIIYHDGKDLAHDMSASGTTSLASNCYIGYAYNDQRWLNGDIAELRIWGVQRTAEQLANNVYELDLENDTEGLIAYWKFNEGAGKTITDQSGNGNDVTLNSDPKWITVSLPESSK
ncbi:DUF1735 and LamG domain-containing protein [uncultured Alistipes sp.]|uniref:DUF1735 and LamG domain-containing protein n=1 Tax=uncultured Alistipes sp. TaxID=538949 RepID=UPI0025EBF823|nr:DUF1735 and LamG domain-containing protein [uncultured Alistipes sp.]